MLPDIERLLILQDRDTRSRLLRAALKSIPVDRAALEDKLAKTKQMAGDAHQRQRAAQVEQSRLENEVRSRRDQIAKYETQKMQTRKNEEYQALNHSIEHLRKEIGGFEDRQLELMEALETLKPQVEAADQAAADAASLVQRQLADLQLKHTNLEAELAELDASRPRYADPIEKGVLEIYNRLFASKKSAVVPLNTDVCGGCFMKVIASTVSSVRAGKSIVHCENCHRILYAH